MQVHTLRFSNTNELSRSYQLLAASVFVEDCVVEPGQLRIRFLAPRKHASALIERIYLDGGLTWCSRHLLG